MDTASSTKERSVMYTARLHIVANIELRNANAGIKTRIANSPFYFNSLIV